MSSRTRKTLSKVADLLEGFAQGILNAVELIMIDAVYGKAKYRKRPSQTRRVYQPRPIIHKTVIIRQK